MLARDLMRISTPRRLPAATLRGLQQWRSKLPILRKSCLNNSKRHTASAPAPAPGARGGGGQINPQIPDNDVDFDKVDTNAVDVADQWLDSFTFDMFEPTNNDTPNATPNDLEHCLAEPIAALTIPIAALVQPQTTPKSRRRKVAVPASQKTERYWKRRGSNTESARKSRHKAKLIRLLRAAAKAAPPIPVEEKEEGNIDVAADADEI